MYKLNAVLAAAQTFSQQNENLWSNNQKGKNIIRKKIVCRKLFLETPKKQFWHTRRKISRKSQNFFAQCPKMKRINFFQKKIASEISYGHLNCSFDNPATEVPKTNHWQSKFDFKKQISEKKIISSGNFSGHVDCSSDKSVETFLTKIRKCGAPCLSSQYHFFSKTTVFPQVVPLDNNFFFYKTVKIFPIGAVILFASCWKLFERIQ